MTLWIAYTARGREFDAQEEAETLGLWAAVPRRVDLIRQGKRRRPDAIVSPYLDNYVFVEADATGWHWLRGSKHVRSLMGVPPQEVAKVQRFIAKVEAEFIAKEAEIDRAVEIMRNREASKEDRREAMKVMQAYTPGDLLEVICGPFAGQIVAFGAMVERAASKLPEIEVSLQGLEWGAMRLDPLHVRKVG